MADMTEGSGRRLAAVDCGTNSTRLLIADEDGASVLRVMRITRLGQGIDLHNELAPAAVARTMAVLREFRGHMDAAGVAQVRMVATSAVRDATNGALFADEAKEVIGVAPEVLSGLDEGQLAYRGANAGLPSFAGDTLVVDIGGGSTELILGREGAVSSLSLQLGCVRLTERYLHHDPPTADEVAATRASIEAALLGAEVEMPELRSLRPERRLIGLAGTVSTLASLELGVEEYDFDRLHHSVLRAAAVADLCQGLSRLSMEARGKLPGMAKGREDVIVGGSLVLDLVLSRYGFDEVTVSETDILDGIIASIS